MFQCLKTIFNISCRPQEYIKSMLIQQPSPTPKDIPALPGASRRFPAVSRVGQDVGVQHQGEADAGEGIHRPAAIHRETDDGDLTGAIINI